MANPQFLMSNPLKAKAITIFFIWLLAVTMQLANSARTLDELGTVQTTQQPANEPDASDPIDSDDTDVAPVVVFPPTILPSGQIPASSDAEPVADVAPGTGPAIPLPTGPSDPPVVAPIGTASPAVGVPGTVVPPVANVAPGATPATPSGTAGAVNSGTEQPTLSFFMHDILGGSHPSGRVVTGIVTKSDVNGLPFTKTTSGVFPLTGGIPLNNVNDIINNRNLPFLVGLNGASPSTTVLQNSGNNDIVNSGGNTPFVTAGQLPTGITLQQLMFGSITVVDNELTEGHELETGVLGRAQGFYVASSLDGSSHTLVLTAMLHGGEHEIVDTISFFGVHRTATPVSHLAIIGGSGKYENAQGHATIETILHQENEHTTDGVETITQFSVYLSVAP